MSENDVEAVIQNAIFYIFRKAGNGRLCEVQGCLPKSCHSLRLGIENFASTLSGRFWPGLAEDDTNYLAKKPPFVEVSG